MNAFEKLEFEIKLLARKSIWDGYDPLTSTEIYRKLSFFISLIDNECWRPNLWNSVSAWISTVKIQESEKPNCPAEKSLEIIPTPGTIRNISETEKIFATYTAIMKDIKGANKKQDDGVQMETLSLEQVLSFYECLRFLPDIMFAQINRILWKSFHDDHFVPPIGKCESTPIVQTVAELRMRASEMSWSCFLCNSTCFSTKRILRQHILGSHSIFKYKCSVPGCKFVTVSDRGVPEHMKSFHHVCPSCDTSCKSTKDLKAHMKTCSVEDEGANAGNEVNVNESATKKRRHNFSSLLRQTSVSGSTTEEDVEDHGQHGSESILSQESRTSTLNSSDVCMSCGCSKKIADLESELQILKSDFLKFTSTVSAQLEVMSKFMQRNDNPNDVNQESELMKIKNHVPSTSQAVPITEASFEFGEPLLSLVNHATDFSSSSTPSFSFAESREAEDSSPHTSNILDQVLLAQNTDFGDISFDLAEIEDILIETNKEKSSN